MDINLGVCDANMDYNNYPPHIVGGGNAKISPL
jgi:hypothetical protein